MTLAFTPTPVSNSTTIDGTPVLYPQGGPYYPTEYAAQHGIAGPLPIEYRTLPLGPRTNVVTTTRSASWSGRTALSGPWSYGAGYSHSENRGRGHVHQRLRAGVADHPCVGDRPHQSVR